MADFAAPSFSLGLDYDLFDSEPPITTDPSSSNNVKLEDNDDDFETLIVDDSEPEFADVNYPKLKRLRRRPTINATSSSSSSSSSFSVKAEVELVTGKRKQIVSDAQEPVSTSCNNLVCPELTVCPLRRSQLIGCDKFSVNDDGNNRKCNRSESCLHQGQSDLPRLGLSKQRKVSQSIDLSTVENPWDDFRSEKSFCLPTPAVGENREICEEIRLPVKPKSNTIQSNRNGHVTKSYSNLDDSLPPAHQYFFHDDPRIQELVRNRLPNFSPLDNVSITELEQPSMSKIDYMGQFSCAKRSIKDEERSRKHPRKTMTEERLQGWVNPKLGVDKGTKKLGVTGKVHAARKTAGHWLTSPGGKKVYVGKNRQELTGRVAYMQYKKENGGRFTKTKKKSSGKKKK